ncbi:amino acid adenylation domain-containing protein [Crossiella sp. SN42]|uniref:non-ribosomal peptide synthetase n=1 Tax=Crossiella sp. SN42 TaxID=2944808 RepID=UPI00207C308F|nr:non-ribosomal peptide synthetase [Crossiella sp. SN42]MCO1579141.1 amino acid adenylation domain-containing protein [Crossiella sp. SN42]
MTEVGEQTRKELLKYLLTQVRQDRLDAERAKEFIRAVGRPGTRPDRAVGPGGDPIAVVGIACRLPGAPDKERFWDNLVSGRESIGDFPQARLDDLRRVLPNPAGLGRGGFLDRIDLFDPEYFGISPRAARELDPYHRHMMEVLVETMEDAGYARGDLDGAAIGVFVGNDHSHRLSMSYLPFLSEVDFSAFAGSWPGTLASRISYHLNLRGPASVTDTGCSSGLVALDTAMKAIRQGDCDSALVAGINLFLSPGSLGSETESGECRVRAFDAGADGTVWSEGVVAVHVKPLARATADGDHVYGVIVGNAVNNDGRSNGITAPNARAQKDVLVAAWKRAGIEPESLSYVEAHGTGTALGDPIEVKGLKAAFGQFTSRRQFCALGSVKSNIGHTVGSAGLASLVKTVLCLDRRMLPPSLHFESPNRHLDLVDSPVYVIDRLTPWEPGVTPRRAGVSSFSLTGTNTHVVLQEAPETPPRPLAGPGVHLYVISARSEELLVRSVARQLDFLDTHPEFHLIDICHTMRVGREHQPVRAVILCHDRVGLRAGLARLLRPRGAHEEPFPDRRTAVLRGRPESPAANHGPQDGGTTLPPGAGTGRRADLPEWFRRHRAAATAYLAGHARPFADTTPVGGARRVPLPPQPFDHARYWDETVRVGPPSPAGDGPVLPGGTDPARSAHPDGKPEPPTTRSVIASVWSEVLGYPEFAGSESFFALGGDSVSSLKIIQRLNAEFDLEIPAPLLLRKPVFDDFADAVAGEFGLSDEPVRGRPDRGSDGTGTEDDATEYELPLTASQRGMLFSGGLDGDSVAYNITGLTIGEGTLDVARLEAGLHCLVSRHDSLRATFHLVDGEPVQRIHAEVEVAVERLHLDAPGPGESHEDRAREQMTRFVRPFRLDEGPLFRVGCFEFGDGVSCVAIDFHHIVTDGTSMGILFRDLAAIVDGAELPPPARGYRSAVRELLERETGADVLRGRHYWCSRFAEGVPTLHLATDRQRTDAVAGAGATLFTELDAETLKAVKDYARTRDLTPSMVLLGVFHQLLSRLSGQTDLVVGTPVAGRPDLSYADVVGMFVNTLPLRISADPADGIGQFFSGLRSTVLEAFEHQACPLELVIEDLDPPREPGRRPLFDVCFVYQNTDLGLEHAGERVVTFDDGSAKYDITLSARESGGRLLMEWEYSTTLFREETLLLHVERYATLLRSVLAAADADPVGALRLVPEQEIEQIRRLATTPAPPLENCGVARLFEQQAIAGPDRTALITDSGRVSYGELNARANRLAHRLSRLGVVPGSPVAILADRSAGLVVAVLGVLKAGCHYVPLNVEFPGERLRLVLRDSGAELIVVTAGRAEQAGELAGDRLQVLDLSTGPEPAADSADPGLPSSSEDPIYIMYTSGTTGAPKGSTIRQKGVLRVVRQSVFYPAGPDDVFLMLSDYSFDGSVYDMFAALTNGAALVVLDKPDVLDLDRLGAAIERHGVTSFFITAAMFHALIDNIPERLAGIRKLIFGGEAASPAHVARAFRLLGPGRIANGYGPTESTVFAAVHTFDSCDERDAVPIGRPINDTSLWVVDENLEPRPIGVPGELCIGGAGLADGYLNQPGLTAERFVESPALPGQRLYRTGDLVTLRSNGLFYYSGRMDDQVKLRGYRIETAEIVHVAVGEPTVRWAHAAVHETGRSLCLWVRYEDGAEPDDARLRAALARRLPGYMVPAFIVRVDAVPLTGNGKLDTAALPAPDLATPASATRPATDAQRRIAVAWSLALGTEVADIDANFFALGGDSIKAIQIAAALKRHGMAIRASDLLGNPTVRMLAEQLWAGSGREEQVHDQQPVSGPMVPGPVQQAFLASADDRDRVFTQCLLITCDAPLPGSDLVRAVERLVRFHDALRVRIDGDGLVLRDPGEEPLVHAEVAPAGLSGHVLTGYLRSLQARVDVVTGSAVALATGLGERGEQCALAIHHLAVDVVSWGILIEDLLTCLADPDAPLAPKSMPFPAWTAELAAHARDGGFRGQLPYWTDLARRAGSAAAMFDEVELRRADTVSEVVSFAAGEATELFDAARTAHGLDPAQTVLAVVACALGAWRGRDRILVTLEGHGREPFAEERDLTRTVGWFTAVFPHLVRLKGSVRDTLRAIGRSFDRLPGKGIGFAPLRWSDPGLGEDAALLAGIRPQVSVNYLGEQGGRRQGVEVRHLPAEVTVDEDFRSPHVLDIIALRRTGDLLVELRHPAVWRARGDDRALVEALRSSFRAVRDAVTARDRPDVRTSPSVQPDVLDDILLDVAGGDR